MFFAAPRARVYAALTDPQQHSRLVGSEATGDAVVGGAFTGGGGYMFGTYDVVDVDTRFVQTWSTTEWPKGHAPSQLEIVLEDAPGGTELVMTHSGLPPAQAEQIRQGWIDFYWTPLRAALGKEV
ncbi:MAG TPA: SRPBCC domain-containing protein [Myxococcota bacterium]